MSLAPEDVQRIVGAARDGSAPHERESWGAFVRRRAPERPGFFAPFERAAFDRALAAAIARGERREDVRALILPFWWGNNEDEEDRDDVWQATTLIVDDADDRRVAEVPLGDETPLWARADLMRVAATLVTSSRAYAPGVAGVERFGRFAAVDVVLRTIVDHVVAGDRVALAASPARMVPAFSMHYVPAFDLASVPNDVADAATRIAAKLTFEPDDEST